MNILGVSGLYHDSAAALVQDGHIVAAAQEERFSRRKHDASFPIGAIRYCLEEGGVSPRDLDLIAWYERPARKFLRIVRGYAATAPRGFERYQRSLPRWARENLWMKSYIRHALGVDCPVEYVDHHLSHAASAYFPSRFQDAVVLTLDAVGEAVTNGIWLGQGNALEPIAEIYYPDSIGLFYSTMTAFCGFRVNDGEYKLMGLAAFGTPRFAPLMKDRIIDVRPDGSYRLNMEFFAYQSEERMGSDALHSLFGAPRAAKDPVGDREADIAASAQAILEEVVVGQARFGREISGSRNLCLAGGVALNCLANSRIMRSVHFDRTWIQPAAGDAGGALGAALWWARQRGEAAPQTAQADLQQGSYLGPGFSDVQIEAALEREGVPHTRYAEAELSDRVAARLSEGSVVGWFQGRMEYGPRALGNRSILADPRNPGMQARLNEVVKHREKFRPFAPIVLEEARDQYFDLPVSSPYMLLVGGVRETAGGGTRSPIPAVTHVDGTARVQTLAPGVNPRLEAVIRAFAARTGVPVLVNTSFNDADEPIVCTPQDAVRAFQRTSLDLMAIGSYLVERPAQTLDAPLEGGLLGTPSLAPATDRVWTRIVLLVSYWSVLVPLSVVARLIGRSARLRTRDTFWRIKRNHPRMPPDQAANVYPLW